MKLKQKRIRTTTKLLSNIEQDENFILGVEIDDVKDKTYKKLGIKKTEENTPFFPSPVLGIMCKRNSIGEYIPQKDKPKETAYKPMQWKLKDWGGYEHIGTDYIPYERYPRKFIEPKEFKLLITKMTNQKEVLIINKKFKHNLKDTENIIFATNLMLELVGIVEVFKLNDDNKIMKIENTYDAVNWEILPQGEKIWESFKNKQKKLISKSKKKLIKERFEFIKEFKPDSIKKGIGGYTGYLIFEFKEKNIFIFDSIVYGDATYIFEDSWEYVSKLSKKEIIQQNLAKDRIIHNKLWENKMRDYLN